MDDTVTAADPPPPYAPPPVGPRRLHRSRSERMWQGVCGGVAEYLGVDPTVVRIGFVLLSILGGVGFLLYGAMWLLVPEEGASGPTRRSPWQVAGLVVIALCLAATFDGWDGGGPSFALALLVIGGVLVWGGREEPAGSSRSASAEAARAPVVAARTGPGRWSWAPPDPTAGPPVPPPVPVGPPERRHTGRALAVATGGLLLAAAAITGAVAASGEIAPTVFLGLTLAGFGVLMAVGSFWGWSRPLAFGGLAVVLALAVASVIDVPLEGGIADRLVRPTRPAEIPTEERLAVGSLDLDLTGLTPDELDGRVIEASVAIGELVVTVPDDLTVDVHAEAGAGLVELFGIEEEGVSAELDHVDDGPEGAPTVHLDLAVGTGHVEVVRGG